MKTKTLLFSALLVLTLILVMLTMVFSLGFGANTTALAATSEQRITESDTTYYNMLAFSIDTAIGTGENKTPYIPGVYLRIANNNYPTISLQLTGSELIPSTKFQYINSDKVLSNFSGVKWKDIDNSEGNFYEAELSLEKDYGSSKTVISEYLYFRTIVEYEGINYFYLCPTYIDVLLDCTGTASSTYGISSIEATYDNGGIMTTYNSNDVEPMWVSSPIEFTVYGLNSSIDNTSFYYSLTDDASDLNPFEIQSETISGETKYKGVISIGQSHDGEVLFYVTDKSQTISPVLAGRKYIRVDTITPVFTVVSSTVDNTDPGLPTVSYDKSKWANGPVTYTIALKPENVGLSGVSFYVQDSSDTSGSGIGWKMINPDAGGNFIYTVSKTTKNLRFKAINDAGKAYEPTTNYPTHISTTVPQLQLVAVDKNNTTIKTKGSTEGTGYRVGYASDSISFMLTNTNPEIPASGVTDVAGVKYEYAYKDGNGEYSAFTEINKIDNNYQYNYTIGTNNTAVKDRTYMFRLRSEAGYIDSEEFTVSVLDSNYSFTMDALNYVTTNNKGWVTFAGNSASEISANAKRGVPVYLYVETFLGDSDEFSFYSEVKGDTSSRKLLTNVEEDKGYVDANNANIKRYTAYIQDTLNRKVMTFFAYNKADAKSQVLSTYVIKGGVEEIYELNLDVATPVDNVVKRLASSKLELDENEWASTSVQIAITPTASLPDGSITTNISGVTCYPIMAKDNSGNAVLGRALTMTDGAFTYSASESYVYSFRLISGAGVYTDFDVSVNIDTNKFDKSGDKWLSVENLSGEEVAIVEKSTNWYSLTKKTAQNLRIFFNTTHGNHITYEWAKMNNNVIPTQDAFTKVENNFDEEQSFVFNLKTGDSGVVSYVFNIYSKAKKADGTFASETSIIITIEYDSATFAIEVKTDQATNSWTKDDIVFDIAGQDAVTIAKYQIRLGEENEARWQDIQVTNKGTSVGYTFSGIEHFITTEVSPDFAEEVKERSYGYSYDGPIYFRAISDAGMESLTCYAGNFKIDKVEVMDTDNGKIYGMHPLYAIYQQTGDYIIDEAGSTKTIKVYSNSVVRFEEPSSSQNSDVRELFAKKSNVDYYYTISSSSSTTAPTIESATKIEGSIEVNTGWYWIIARNTEFSKTMSYMVYVAKEASIAADPSILSAEFDTYSGVGAKDYQKDGYFVFSWSNTATVLITATSNSPVYYWYKIGSKDVWTKFNPLAGSQQADGSSVDLTFLGEETAQTATYINATNYIKEGNLNDTVVFRVTNLAGNVIYINKGVWVRIEDSDPAFSVSLHSTDLQGNDITIDANNADELTKWYPNAIQMIITPTANNPGGVEYKYQKYNVIGGNAIGEGSLEKLPGNGKNFTTEDLSIFQDKDGNVNGSLQIFIVATSLATGKTYRYQLKLNIDKTMPEFDLEGKVNIGGVEKSIASGEWTNSTGGVTIYRYVSDEVQASIDSASGVTYQYRRNGSVLQNWDVTSLTESSISTYQFIATTGAGRTYVATFEVKIDTLAPVINSGYIEQNLDRIETYYIDQVITYDEEHLKYAKYNNFPLTNGQIIATDTVAPDNGGYVHIVIEDLAGNITEMEFYMTTFPLTVNTITLSEDDAALLANYENTYKKSRSGLRSSRQEYFDAYISRLNDRVATLKKQRDDYRAYLVTINNRVSFTLQDDYPEMYQYINYFITDDVTILYPQWLQDEIRTGVYDTYYLKLQTEYNKLEDLMKAVKAVEKSAKTLTAINVVEKTDYQEILRVYNAYESLSTDQKSVFSENLYNKILELKRKCEVLLLQDDTTGISIDGDKLASGVAIEVFKYERTVEAFVNAQETLLSTVASDEYIVSITKLSLSGNGSQQETGKITITIPIPSEYYSYIYFNVYRLSSDGTVTPINNTTITGDGKSVYFVDDHLDTYILSTKGNVTVQPESEEIYGTLGGIEIDSTLLTYGFFIIAGLFVILVVVMIVMGIKRKGFFRKYNRAYRKSLRAKGIQNIPKGNTHARTYPDDPTTRMDGNPLIFDVDKNKRNF